MMLLHTVIMEPTRAQKTYVQALLCWVIFTSTAVALLNWKQPIKHAATCMGLGLVVLWIVFGGGLMVRFRNPIMAFVSSIKLKWQVRFVLFCTLLAMTEEAITTLMTNTAPLYGLKMGQAYITASSDYIDVILLHGVCVFVSFFVGWAVILSNYQISHHLPSSLYSSGSPARSSKLHSAGLPPYPRIWNVGVRVWTYDMATGLAVFPRIITSKNLDGTTIRLQYSCL